MVEETKDLFEIVPLTNSFASIIQEANLSEERKNELKGKNILFLPQKKIGEKEGTFFYGGARDFSRFCQENAPNQLMDFCTEISEYSEIDLNSHELFLGPILVTTVVIPFFVSLLANFVSSKLMHKDDRIIVSIIICDNSESTNIEIKFNGTRENFEENFIKSISTYNKEDIS